MGNVIQAGNRMNPARQAAIGGGVPVAVPALTVNRVCGSGAQAIASAAQEIWLGQVDAAVAGGMENMDRATRPCLVRTTASMLALQIRPLVPAQLVRLG
jgi:acetyl-CoA C-acetyltransferase